MTWSCIQTQSKHPYFCSSGAGKTGGNKDEVFTHQTSSASTSHSAPNWQISQVEVSFWPVSAEPSPPTNDRKRQRKKKYLQHRSRLVSYPGCRKNPKTVLSYKKQSIQLQLSQGTLASLHMNLKSPLKPSPPAFPVPEASPLPCLISPIIPSIHIDLYGFSLLFRAADFLALGFGGTWQCWSQPYGSLGTPWVHITLHEQPRGEEITGKKSNLVNLKLHFATTEESCLSEIRYSLLSPRPNSPLKTLYFRNSQHSGGRLWIGRRRGGTWHHFPAVISLISPTRICTGTHTAAEVLPRVAFHFSFTISCYFSWSLVTPWGTWKALYVGALASFSTAKLKLDLTLLRSKSVNFAALSSAVESSQRFQSPPPQLSAGIFLVAGWD